MHVNSLGWQVNHGFTFCAALLCPPCLLPDPCRLQYGMPVNPAAVHHQYQVWHQQQQHHQYLVWQQHQHQQQQQYYQQQYAAAGYYQKGSAAHTAAATAAAAAGGSGAGGLAAAAPGQGLAPSTAAAVTGAAAAPAAERYADMLQQQVRQAQGIEIVELPDAGDADASAGVGSGGDAAAATAAASLPQQQRQSLQPQQTGEQAAVPQMEAEQQSNELEELLEELDAVAAAGAAPAGAAGAAAAAPPLPQESVPRTQVVAAPSHSKSATQDAATEDGQEEQGAAGVGTQQDVSSRPLFHAAAGGAAPAAATTPLQAPWLGAAAEAARAGAAQQPPPWLQAAAAAAGAGNVPLAAPAAAAADSDVGATDPAGTSHSSSTWHGTVCFEGCGSDADSVPVHGSWWQLGVATGASWLLDPVSQLSLRDEQECGSDELAAAVLIWRQMGSPRCCLLRPHGATPNAAATYEAMLDVLQVSWHALATAACTFNLLLPCQ